MKRKYLVPWAELFSGGLCPVPAVCFAELPLDDLGLHMQKYGCFGLSFKKRYLIGHGARPVTYIPKNSPNPVTGKGRGTYIPTHLRELYANISHLVTRLFPHGDVGPTRREGAQRLTDNNALQETLEILAFKWHFVLTEMIFYIKVFDDEKPLDDPDNYYTEREWRVTHDVYFGAQDIATIIVPTEYRERVETDFPNLAEHVYCPCT